MKDFRGEILKAVQSVLAALRAVGYYVNPTFFQIHCLLACLWGETRPLKTSFHRIPTPIEEIRKPIYSSGSP